MSDESTVTTTEPASIKPLIYDESVNPVVPVGVQSLGDAVSVVMGARETDLTLYTIAVHLHKASVPRGNIKGLVILQQMPNVNINRPNEWVANEIYECPNDRVGDGRCKGILTDDVRHGPYWMCPKCGCLATNDADDIPSGGVFDDHPVFRNYQKYYSFGAAIWGDVLAEYVQRVWSMEKLKGQDGYKVMLLIRRPRQFLQLLTHKFLEEHSARTEDALVAGRSTQSSMGVEYVLYGPDAIAKDLESGTSLAKRLEVLMRGG